MERDASLVRSSHDHDQQQQQRSVDAEAPLDGAAVQDQQLLRATRDTTPQGHHHCSGSSVDTLLRPESCPSAARARVVVALFRDGFVCRHLTETRESVEGFAQPYDMDGRYFLGCIERGVVPDGLVDMISGAYPDDSAITAEIWDFRESSALCPVSFAALPRESPVRTQSRGCKVFKVVLLRPPESSNNCRHHQVGVFDHFPELSPGELEILAGDAERQLLEVGIPSTWHESSLDAAKAEADLSIQSGCWINAGPAPDAHDPSEILTSNSRSARFNLVLDQDAFPTLALSYQHSASATLLSPTEPKLQVINKAQRQQVTRQKKRTVPGKGKLKAEIESLNQGKVLPVNSEVLEKTPTKQRKEPANPQKKTISHRSPKNTETSFPPKSPPPPPLAVSAKASTRKKRVNTSSSDSPIPTSSDIKSPVDKLSHYASLPPLPATQHFLSKLKGKRQRSNFEELQYGMPVRLTINHIGIFFHAAMRFEHQHAFFLHTNVKRLMHPDEPTQPPCDVSPVGSMNYLAEQLGGARNPLDVIKVPRINQTVDPDEQSDTWGPAGSASTVPFLKIVSSEVERLSPQAYPIQLPPPQSPMESDSELVSGASLYDRWLALADL